MYAYINLFLSVITVSLVDLVHIHIYMVANPLCPVSFGLLGFVGAVLSRRGFLYSSKEEESGEEIHTLLDSECQELSEERIATYLETKKNDYYESIGMNPPAPVQNADLLTVTHTAKVFALDKEDVPDDAVCATAPSTPHLICHSDDSADELDLNS